MSKTAVIRLFGGRLVNVLDVKPEDIEPRVFVHALSCINRYTGHCKRPYSVAEHTCKLAGYLLNHGKHPDLIRAVLLHDWSEALFNDLASPLKKNFASYQQYEKKAQKVIFARMQVPWELEAEIKEYDTRIRVNEKAFFWDGADLSEYREGSAIFEGLIEPLEGITFRDELGWKDARDALASWIIEYFRGIEGV